MLRAPIRRRLIVGNLFQAYCLRRMQDRFEMALKINTAAQIIILSILRGVWNGTNLKLALYKSNTTPGLADIIATYTESTFAGYARSVCSNWTAPATVSARAAMTADAKTFTRASTGAGENVYGYYVTDSTYTFLYWAERDAAAPIVLTNLGDSYTVTPAHTFTTEF